MLTKRGLKHSVYLNSITVKRLFAVAFSLAFKMISEIDMMSVNANLADILGLSVKHFYRMECSIY